MTRARLPAVTSVAGVTRAQVLGSISRSATLSITAAVAVVALSACGGDDDDTSSTTQPPPSSSAATLPVTSSTAAPVVTEPPTTPPTSLVLVTEGAIVVVANASSVNGAAGRMTDELARAGFQTTQATNSSEKLGTTKVYFNASVPEAQAVAESVAAALGGGDIAVEPLPTPAPLKDPETIGDATVLVALGEDTADRTLAQLQGGGSGSTESSAPSSEAGTSAPPSSGG